MKRKTNDNGFSLVEMVVAMALLSIFITFMATMMMTATKARSTSMSSAQSSTSASAISTVLENDIKRSGTFYSYTGDGKIHTVRMAKADGTCVAWRVVNGKVQRAEVDGTQLTGAWPTINWAQQPVYSEKAKAVGDEQLFTWIDGTINEGKLQYKIELGDENGGSIVQGVVEPEVASSGKGYCW